MTLSETISKAMLTASCLSVLAAWSGLVMAEEPHGGGSMLLADDESNRITFTPLQPSRPDKPPHPPGEHSPPPGQGHRPVPPPRPPYAPNYRPNYYPGGQHQPRPDHWDRNPAHRYQSIYGGSGYIYQNDCGPQGCGISTTGTTDAERRVQQDFIRHWKSGVNNQVQTFADTMNTSLDQFFEPRRLCRDYDFTESTRIVEAITTGQRNLRSEVDNSLNQGAAAAQRQNLTDKAQQELLEQVRSEIPQMRRDADNSLYILTAISRWTQDYLNMMRNKAQWSEDSNSYVLDAQTQKDLNAIQQNIENFRMRLHSSPLPGSR